MNREKQMILNWIKIGIINGLLVSVIYPLLQFVSNLVLGVILAISMGLTISLASAGLYYFITLYKRTITAKIGLFSNIIAGTILMQMFLIQLAIKSSRPDIINDSGKWIWNSLNHIHYGLDVCWDVYIFAGTLLFAINAFQHPKLGKLFSVTGVAIASLMIITNVSVFPIPPSSAQLIDFGPFVGLWYLAVTIKILFSYKWIKQELIKSTV
jgi:hypothetical protein